MDGNWSFSDWRQAGNGKYNMKHILRDGREGLSLCRREFNRPVGGLDFTGTVNCVWNSCGLASPLLLWRESRCDKA